MPHKPRQSPPGAIGSHRPGQVGDVNASLDGVLVQVEKVVPRKLLEDAAHPVAHFLDRRVLQKGDEAVRQDGTVDTLGVGMSLAQPRAGHPAAFQLLKMEKGSPEKGCDNKDGDLPFAGRLPFRPHGEARPRCHTDASAPPLSRNLPQDEVQSGVQSLGVRNCNGKEKGKQRNGNQNTGGRN